jgi:hypothetical protein
VTRILPAVFGAVALVVSVIVWAAAPASASTLRLWTLSGVTFDDGGTLSGTLVVDSDGNLQGVDVTTSGGDTATYGTYEYKNGPGHLIEPAVGGGWTINRNDGQYLLLKLPDTTSAVEGDTLTLPDGGYECLNCAQTRFIDAGSIVAGGNDVTPPVITTSVSPSSPDGEHGWYVGNPTVSFDVTDPDSSISDQQGCAPQTIDTDTSGTTITCQATSGGGTSSHGVTIHRDATPPRLKPVLTPKRKILLHGRVRVHLHARDHVSGVAGGGCAHLSTARAGARKATCTATDRAGNQASAKVRYTVQYVMTRLHGTTGWRTGRAVTVETRLTDARGHAISKKQAAALGCRVKLHVSGAQTRRGCLSYDKATRTFSSTWRLSGKTGASRIAVVVRYPHSRVKTSRSATVTTKRA